MQPVNETATAPPERQPAPPADATVNEAAEEQASPEVEAAMGKAIDAALNFIHKKGRKQIDPIITGDAKEVADQPLFKRVADVAYPLVMKMMSKGEKQGMEFWQHVATVIIEELFGVAEAASVPIEDPDKEMEAAYYAMVVRYGEDHQDDPEVQEAAKAAATELAQSGMMEQAMQTADELYSGYATGGQPRQPMAAAVSRGLAGGA